MKRLLAIAAGLAAFLLGAAAAEAGGLEPVAQLGGATRAVVVRGHYAYLGMGPRLVIVDVADPEHPSLVGQSDVLPELVNRVAVSGDYAYVLTSRSWDGVISEASRLLIIHVGDPSKPTLAGSLTMPTYGDIAVSSEALAVSGTTAYVGDYLWGLHVVDASSAVSPTIVGFLQGSVNSVAVAGAYAYLAGQPSGLRVVNISNPRAPFKVGECSVSYGYDVVVSGTTALVADYDSGLRIIDVSNPAAPTQVSAFYTSWRAYGVAVEGEYAYIAELPGWQWPRTVGGGLQIVNIAQPAAPALAATLPMPAGEGRPGQPWRVAVSGGYAFVADVARGLRAVSVANKAAPAEVGFYEALGQAESITVAGDTAYVADGRAGLQLVGLGAPLSPTLLGALPLPGYACGVAVSGDYAYVADGPAGLRIINTSNPLAPAEAGSYVTPGSAMDVAVAGDYAYVADGYVSFGYQCGWGHGGGGRGMRVITVTNPAQPVLASSYSVSNDAEAVAVHGDLAYVAAQTLDMVSVADPLNPTLVGQSSWIGAHDVAVTGTLAYVVTSNSLVILDVTNPALPTQVGSLALASSGDAVAVAGRYAYVASGYRVSVVDVANPAAPVLVTWRRLPGEVRGVATLGDHAIVAARDGGVWVLRLDLAYLYLPMVLRN